MAVTPIPSRRSRCVGVQNFVHDTISRQGLCLGILYRVRCHRGYNRLDQESVGGVSIFLAQVGRGKRNCIPHWMVIL